MNFNSPTYYTMSNLKSYNTLKDFVATLKTLPTETSTKITEYKLLEYDARTNKCNNTNTPNCLVLLNSTIDTEISLKRLISELKKFKRSYPDIPVFYTTDGTLYNCDRYKLIDMPKVEYNLNFKVDDRKIKDLQFVNTDNEAITFVKLLNDNEIKNLETAKALANEKYNFPNIVYDNRILYYNNKWYTFKEIYKIYTVMDRDIECYEYPIYIW